MDTATTEIYTLSLHDALPILVPGALAEAVIVGHQLPGVAAIIGAVDAALLGLDDGPHAIRISAGNGYADSSQWPVGQSVAGQLFPGITAVAGAVEGAARAARLQAPGRALRLPKRGKKQVGIAGSKSHVNAAALGVLVEHLLPSLAAVERAEDAAFFVIGEGMAEGSHKNPVGILWINNDAADGVSVGQPGRLPGFAGVNGLVHAVATHNVAADAGLAGARVNHIRI